MPANDNAHALRMISALRDIHGESAADAFSQSFPLSKSADVTRKHHWACNVCTALESQFGAEDAATIRRACRCGDGATMAKEILSCIKKAGSLTDGCTLFTQKNHYAFLEYVDEHSLIFGYHDCVCSCIKRAEGNVPRLWCECSAGYTEAMFRQLFGDTVCVTLLGTAKSGDSRCTFSVRW